MGASAVVYGSAIGDFSLFLYNYKRNGDQECREYVHLALLVTKMAKRCIFEIAKS